MKRSMYACGALFVVLGAAMIVGGLSAGSAGGTTLLPVGAIFLPCAALFFWVGSWGVMGNGRLRSTADLQRFGRPSAATVLEVDVAPPSDGADGGARLTLRVTPRNERPYTAQVSLPLNRVAPLPGDVVGVKFDPNKRKSLIVTGGPPAERQRPMVIGLPS